MVDAGAAGQAAVGVFAGGRGTLLGATVQFCGGGLVVCFIDMGFGVRLHVLLRWRGVRVSVSLGTVGMGSGTVEGNGLGGVWGRIHDLVVRGRDAAERARHIGDL
jgi:hypothetical protein